MDHHFGFPPMEENTDVSFIKRKYLDIPYATISPAQKLDIYLPDEGEGPFPVILSIHGGAFELGDKRDNHVLPFLEGIEHGFAVVSLNYRLSSEAIFPAAVQDLKAAVRWIRANQRVYHLDGARIAAWGGSAGGNLASMLGVSGATHDFDDPTLGNMEYPSNVQAVVSWFGPFDFPKMDAQHDQNRLRRVPLFPGSPEVRYVGGPFNERADLVRKANPATYLHKGIPPFFIQHGRVDGLVPYQQAVDFADAMKKIAPSALVYFEILETADHDDPQFTTPQNMGKVFAFLKKALA